MVMYIQYSANCKRGLSSILKDSYFKKGLQMFFQMFEILETVALGSTVGGHSILRYHNDFEYFFSLGKLRNIIRVNILGYVKYGTIM